MKFSLRNLISSVTILSVLVIAPIAAAQNLDEFREEWRLEQYRKVLPQLLAYAERLGDKIGDESAEVDYMIGISWCKLRDPNGGKYLLWAATRERLDNLPIYDKRLVEECESGAVQETRNRDAGMDGKFDQGTKSRSQVLQGLMSLNGTWRYTMSSNAGGGTHSGNMNLEQSGNRITGSMEIEGRKQRITGTYSEGSIELERDTGAETIQKYSLTRSGNTLSGRFRNEGKYADSGTIKIERGVMVAPPPPRQP